MKIQLKVCALAGGLLASACSRGQEYVGGAQGAAPTEPSAQPAAAPAEQIERGRYLVSHVALCSDCHSPRRADGSFDPARWLSGVDCFVDALPAFYLVGGVASLLNTRGQRLGDLAANTLVLREPQLVSPDLEQLFAGKFNSLREHPHLAARLRQRDFLPPCAGRLRAYAWLRGVEAKGYGASAALSFATDRDPRSPVSRMGRIQSGKPPDSGSFHLRIFQRACDRNGVDSQLGQSIFRQV